MNKLSLRNKVVVNFGLADDKGMYDNVAEAVIETIVKETSLHYMDISMAIGVTMLDFEVKNAPFYDELRPYYTENYKLIPILGIDGLLNKAVEDLVVNAILEDKVVDAINKAVAFDYAIKAMKENVEYKDDLLAYLDGINVKDFYDLTKMFKDIDVALDVYEVKKEKKKEKEPKEKTISIAPGINVVILDDDGIADDILALLKFINGGK